MMEDVPPPSDAPQASAKLNFRAVWDTAGFSLRFVIVLTAAFLLLTVSHLLSVVLADDGPSSYKAVSISGEASGIGIYDPSVAFESEKNGWLAYSALKSGGADALVEVHMAITQNGGKNWSYSGTPVFMSRRETLYGPDGVTPLAEGVVRYEVPGLLYDPDDKGKEWKIFAYRYFWNGDVDLAQKTAVIAYKTSSNPLEKWSEEVWLFSARSGIPPPPYDRLVLLPLLRLSSEFSDIVSFSEPAPFLKDGKTYLLLTAFTRADRPARLVLLQTADHGQSWLYLGTILKETDSGKKETVQLSGGSLVSVGGKIYLLAGFGDANTKSFGVEVFEVADISKAALRRDPKTGLPVRVDVIVPRADQSLTALGAGSAAYHENLVHGALISQMGMDGGRPVFNILKTFRKIGEKD